MLSDHVAIHAPAIGEANERAQADLIDPRLAETIRRIQAPEEVLLLPLQMMLGVHALMIRFLIDHHAVQAERFQLSVLIRAQRLHLHL